MATASIGECFSYGVDKLKSNPAFAIVGFFLVGIIGGVTMGILTGPLMVGYFKGLAKSDRGEKAEIGDVFSGFENIGAGIVVGIIHAVLFMLCMIPGLIAAPAAFAAYRLIAEGEKDGMAAFKKGWAASKPDLVPSIITFIVVGFVCSLGSIACYIGMYVTMPIAIAGFYLMAGKLLGSAPAEAAAADAPAEDAGGDEPEEKSDG